jgi:hypothetical protein
VPVHESSGSSAFSKPSTRLLQPPGQDAWAVVQHASTSGSLKFILGSQSVDKGSNFRDISYMLQVCAVATSSGTEATDNTILAGPANYFFGSDSLILFSYSRITCEYKGGREVLVTHQILNRI